MSSSVNARSMQVPNVLHFCEENSITGTPFYLMEHVKVTHIPHTNKDHPIWTDAFCRELCLPTPIFHPFCLIKDSIFTEALPVGGPPTVHRETMVLCCVATLGTLHNVDVSAIGLDQFGKPSGYCQRQVCRRSYPFGAKHILGASMVATVQSGNPSLRSLHDRTEDLAREQHPSIGPLFSNPSDHTWSHFSHGHFFVTSYRRCTGDFLLNNLIFTEERGHWNVRAIVDWELSTLVCHCLFYPSASGCLHLREMDGWMWPMPVSLSMHLPVMISQRRSMHPHPAFHQRKHSWSTTVWFGSLNDPMPMTGHSTRCSLSSDLPPFVKEWVLGHLK